MRRILTSFLFIVFLCTVYGENTPNSTQTVLPLAKAGLSNQIPDHLIGLMVEFQEESDDNPATSGTGTLLQQLPEAVSDRCNGFIVDPPPHNQAYFTSQFEAVRHYYFTASCGSIDFSYTMLPDIIQLTSNMASYAESDSALGRLFAEAVEAAENVLTPVFTESSIIVVFHAGIGQDFSFPFLDPTPLDLSSAYIDEIMLEGQNIPEINGIEVNRGLLLPESQNHLFYDVIEDLYYGESDYCDYQIGLTGTFSFLLGYALNLPPLFNTDTGDAGVGIFGLMDHGSNSGRGVIPAMPTAWTRIMKGWDTPINLRENGVFSINAIDPETLFDALTENEIIRIDITDGEYFLIENHNNWVDGSRDMDKIRYDDRPSDDRLAHFFDTMFLYMDDHQVRLDDETGVILGFNHYNYGLPHSGLLIWHITEPDPIDLMNGINNDRENRAVHLEEADGAVDIGYRSTALFDDPSAGWEWDMWYGRNPAYFVANPSEYFSNPESYIRFDNFTLPNTRSNSGAESFISLSEIDTAAVQMTFQIMVEQDITFDPLPYSDAAVVGSWTDAESGNGKIAFLRDSKLYVTESAALDSIPWGNPDVRILYSSLCDTVIIPTADYADHYLSEQCAATPYDSPLPQGYLFDSATLTAAWEEGVLGDLDGDGLDELLTVDELSGTISAMNSNMISVNGFPVSGQFFGTPLIGDIMTESGPEIICREDKNIVILSAEGVRLRTIASYEINAELRLVPNYRPDVIGLVDGYRVLHFPQNLDQTYWPLPNGQSSNLRSVSGSHVNQITTVDGLDTHRAYNYPNPVMDGITTFRYFVGESVTRIDFTVFDAAGYQIADFTETSLTGNEYNETTWDASDLDSGVYFVRLKPDHGSEKLLNVVVLR